MKWILAMVFSSLVAVGSVLCIAYKNSWIEEYAQAEPLHPIADEFARELRRLNTENLDLDDLRSLLQEERFREIRGYGFIPPTQDDTFAVLKINDFFAFPLYRDGHAGFEKKTEQGAAANP